MADTKVTALTEISVPALTNLLYTVDDPGGTPVSNKVTTQRIMGLGGLIPGGRLTLTTAVPVTTSDVTAAGTLYYTPYLHNLVRVWDGTRWLLKTFSEISLSLTLTSGKNYDVFLDDDAATLVLSAAWTNDTTRADALGTQDSVQVLNSDKTKLWLGTIRASGSNTTEDSAQYRLVWNAYNRERKNLLIFDTTDTWTYSTAAYRKANNSSSNRVGVVVGLAGQAIELDVDGLVLSTVGIVGNRVAIGEDSETAAASGQIIHDGVNSGANSFGNPRARLVKAPALGYHYYQWLEHAGASGGTQTWHGDNGAASLDLYGITGTWFC